MTKTLILAIALLAVAPQAQAEWTQRTCLGNIETEDRLITTPGVQYKVFYDIKGETGLVSFAGRTFPAKVEYSESTWKGPWIKEFDRKSPYFSYLPDNGGEVRFEFSKDQWFAGNC